MPMAISRSPFVDRRIVFGAALLCCLLWGSSFPAIKTGYVLFQIAPGDVPTKLLFAGWRFLFAGLALMGVCAIGRKPVWAIERGMLSRLTVLGLTQTALQYLIFYIGIANTTGVKGSILNATGTFFSVLLAHFIYRNDRLSHRKVLGCVFGFAGVAIVNVGRGPLDFEFTLLGEGFVVSAAFVLAASSIYGKRLSQQIDSVVMTAWQLTIGGMALLLVGWAFGGSLRGFTLESTALLVYLVMLSAVAISLWSLLLEVNRVSLVTAFNFMVPVFGALLSALFLNERILESKNALALVLVCAGIWWVMQEPDVRDNRIERAAAR